MSMDNIQDLKIFGEKVRKVRKSQPGNLSLAAFGDRIGASKGTLSAIENGKGKDDNRMLINSICYEFGIDREFFEHGGAEMFTSRTVGKDVSDEAIRVAMAYDRLSPEKRNECLLYMLELSTGPDRNQERGE